jgi:glutamyl-Q tRNA(Asp) synthetase
MSIATISAQHHRPRYRGRFAPSPSGDLHFGSLIAAVASYLDAKAHHGQWLVRIENIDPPREQPHADRAILKTLEAFGLYWDESVRYQANHYDTYQQVLAELHAKALCYYCHCTRAQIKAHQGIYPGTCRHKNLSPNSAAVRLVNQQPIISYQDIFQGEIHADRAFAAQDFILKRRDGLYAYQLAVVVDDAAQGITHVVRGADLLMPTVWQLSLFKTLGQKPPQYGHVPLAVTSKGFKLSKQNHAPALNCQHPQPELLKALSFLGLPLVSELSDATVEEILNWAINHWQREHVPKLPEIIVSNEQ